MIRSEAHGNVSVQKPHRCLSTKNKAMPGVPHGRGCNSCRQQKKKVRLLLSWYSQQRVLVLLELTTLYSVTNRNPSAQGASDWTSLVSTAASGGSFSKTPSPPRTTMARTTNTDTYTTNHLSSIMEREKIGGSAYTACRPTQSPP